MGLVQEFQTQGTWLFRWRSYLPLVLLVLVGVAIQQTHFPFGRLWIHEIWEEICLGISFLGLVVRGLAIGYAPSGTSGRNTRRLVAETLSTTGIYSVVRHPLYLGNFLIGLGISLVLWVWWLPLIYALAFCIYYERIMLAEEAFLHAQFGKSFDHWASQTPAFWPRFSRWRRPSHAFSHRNVLRREYTGLLVVILGHTGIEFAEHSLLAHYDWQTHWSILAISGLAAYLTLRTLKKRTSLLDVSGR